MRMKEVARSAAGGYDVSFAIKQADDSGEHVFIMLIIRAPVHLDGGFFQANGLKAVPTASAITSHASRYEFIAPQVGPDDSQITSHLKMCARQIAEVLDAIDKRDWTKQ